MPEIKPINKHRIIPTYLTTIVMVNIDTSANSISFYKTYLYIEKAKKSHLARVVVMDITVVVTYPNYFSCR